jgi:hypothetical protein
MRQRMTVLRPSCRLSLLFAGALLASAKFALATIKEVLQNAEPAFLG